MPAENRAGKRRRGYLNGIQNQIVSIHMSTILTILSREHGLNISQIATRFPRTRTEIVKASVISPELEKKLPTGENPDNLRKTVRKHLIQMLSFGQVKLADGKYYLVDRKESDLVKMVDQVYTTIKPQNWSYLAAEDSAICRTYVKPQAQHYDFDGFFGDHLSDFQRSIFHLDRILIDAIGKGHLSPRFYDPISRKLSLAQLELGWNTHFKDTELLVWTFALSPSRLIRFLESEVGEQMMRSMLEKNGEEILARGRKRLSETRWLQRKMKRFQAKTHTVTNMPERGSSAA